MLEKTWWIWAHVRQFGEGCRKAGFCLCLGCCQEAQVTLSLGLSNFIDSQAKAITVKRQQSFTFARIGRYLVFWAWKMFTVCLCPGIITDWSWFCLHPTDEWQARPCFLLLSYTTDVSNAHVWVSADVLWLNKETDGTLTSVTAVEIAVCRVQKQVFQHALP